MLSIVACNKTALYMDQGDKKSPTEERRRQEEEQKRQAAEKAATKREADGRAWAEQVGTQAAALAATQAGFEQFWNESPTIQKQQAQMRRSLATFRKKKPEREPVLFINTSPYAFEPPELVYRSDVYSYDCLTKQITFQDGTSGYYPEALEDRDAK